MKKFKDNVAIQFIKGKDEKNTPEIRLFRSHDGKKGQAIYIFYKPTTITLENSNAIKEMCLIDEEGKLSTRKIELSISDQNTLEVKSTYNWNSDKEFERFMRFAKRFANSLNNY
tara:strand:+ start:1161 stop:1502 length:342 start_codon:yes stop_codon:yes gene_type:complete